MTKHKDESRTNLIRDGNEAEGVGGCAKVIRCRSNTGVKQNKKHESFGSIDPATDRSKPIAINMRLSAFHAIQLG